MGTIYQCRQAGGLTSAVESIFLDNDVYVIRRDTAGCNPAVTEHPTLMKAIIFRLLRGKEGRLTCSGTRADRLSSYL